MDWFRVIVLAKTTCLGIGGFLGSRGSLMLDAVFLAMFVVVPAQTAATGWLYYWLAFVAAESVVICQWRLAVAQKTHTGPRRRKFPRKTRMWQKKTGSSLRLAERRFTLVGNATNLPAGSNRHTQRPHPGARPPAGGGCHLTAIYKREVEPCQKSFAALFVRAVGGWVA